MNVRGAHLEGFDNERINQFDQRRVGFHYGAIVGSRCADLDVLPGEFFDHLLVPRIARNPALAVIAVERRFDVRFGGDAQINFGPEQMPQTVNGVEVGRISQGNGKSVVALKDGNNAIFSGDVPRDGGNDLIGDFHFVEVDDFGAEVGSLGLGDIGRPDNFVGQHQIHQADAGSLG